jgi:hypothetical protein
MTAIVRMGLAAAVCGFLAVAPASAEDNLDSGKTPAQLFASDCAICHKTPQAVSKAGNALGGARLQGFLREHYTASREVAAAIAAYVQAAGRSSAPGEKKRATKPKADSKAESKAAAPQPKDDTAAASAADKGVGGKADTKPDTKPEPAPTSKSDTEKKPD